MRRLGLDDIKALELGVLKELKRVCEKNDLAYSLAFGTALGAERHQGFIPWDDDIDVYMPRSDYERLYELCKFDNALDKRYQLVTYRDGSSIYPFFKLVDTHTTSYETFVGKHHPLALWVDIFPLEPAGGVSNREIRSALKRYRRIALLRSFAVADPNNGSTIIAILAKHLIGPFARRLNPYKLAARLEAVARGAQGTTESNELIDFCACRHTIDKSLIFPTKPVAFEDDTFQGPARPDEYLTYCYGDWRTPLPPSNQNELHFPEAYLLDDSELS